MDCGDSASAFDKSSLACSLSKNREINLDIFGKGKAGDRNPDRRGEVLVTRIKALNRYQKAVLIVMGVMILIFMALYFRTISRVGFEYQDTIFVPYQENGSTVYSGKFQGKQSHFTVSEKKTVMFQWGDMVYGPYTAKKDPTAIPKDDEFAEGMTGVALYQGEDILFRGGVLKTEDIYWLYNEDGSLENLRLSFTGSDGIERDEYGNEIDSVQPTADTILKLMDGPELMHKGEWLMWFGAVCVCILNGLSILFADELFRWNLSFQIRNAEHAEPSEMQIAGRYTSWTVLTIMALVLFIMGLQ